MHALPEGTDARAVVLVEGTSDKVALETLARRRGRDLVAEGVERPGELAVLRGLGVAAAQGFYLARPVPRPLLDLRPRAVVAVPRPLQRV